MSYYVGKPKMLLGVGFELSLVNFLRNHLYNINSNQKDNQKN